MFPGGLSPPGPAAGHRRVPPAHRPSVVLVLVPSPWEQRFAGEFCLKADLQGCYVGVERWETLEKWDRPAVINTIRLAGPAGVPIPFANLS